MIALIPLYMHVYCNSIILLHVLHQGFHIVVRFLSPNTGLVECAPPWAAFHFSFLEHLQSRLFKGPRHLPFAVPFVYPFQ